jgi:predicted DNA-binding transcriptional regulator AlpA
MIRDHDPSSIAQSPAHLHGPFVGRKEIAKHFRVTTRTVARWRSRGFLPSPDVQIGRVLRWRQSTIDTWEKERKGTGFRTW